MDEQMQKRITDCVYFLASPLTCKKGLDCEYRHSEIARLNPRDCWYWLAGNCFNSSCGFRHPPVDAHADPFSESTTLSGPVNKTRVSCFFYSNGFCSKGDRCSFLHGSDKNRSSEKSLRTLSLENKTSIGNDTLLALKATPHLKLGTSLKPTTVVRVQALEDLQKSASMNILKQSVSPDVSGDDCEEAALVKSGSFSAEGFIQARSQLRTGHGSEDEVDDHFEPEERWESSPGFDVLVDNKSENLCYEDEPELDLDMKPKEQHLMRYEFEDPLEYDPMYTPELDDQLNNELIFEELGRISCKSREGILSRKRKRFFSIDLDVDDRKDMDLRDHLRKQRLTDDYNFGHISRMPESRSMIDRNQERLNFFGHRQRSAIFLSEVVHNSIESRSGYDILSNGVRQHERLRHSQSNRSRQLYKEKGLTKRHSHSSEYSSKSVSKERKSSRSAKFTGPKTLTQIKEEKKRRKEHREFRKSKHISRTASSDFQGPKPLSQILKDKKKVSTVMDGNTCSN